MTLLQRLCPHIFGWSYNTYRTRRFCRACAHQQRAEHPAIDNHDEIRELMQNGDTLSAQRLILEAMQHRTYVDAT